MGDAEAAAVEVGSEVEAGCGDTELVGDEVGVGAEVTVTFFRESDRLREE